MFRRRCMTRVIPAYRTMELCTMILQPQASGKARSREGVNAVVAKLSFRIYNC